MQYTITVNGVIRPCNLALYICSFNPTDDNKLLMGEMRLCCINYDDFDRRYYDSKRRFEWLEISMDQFQYEMSDLSDDMLERINKYLPDDYHFGHGGVNSIGGNKIGYWQWPSELMGE